MYVNGACSAITAPLNESKDVTLQLSRKRYKLGESPNVECLIGWLEPRSGT